MSDLPAAAPTAQSSTVFEQKIFELSPLGPLLTAAAIFVLLLASFEAVALATGYAFADQLSFSPRQGAWPAVVVSLLAAVALGMQRYSRLKDIEDAPALSRLMACDATAMTSDADSRGRIRRAGWTGAIVGLGASFPAAPAEVRIDHLPVFLWFAAVMMLLGVLFARGATMTRIAARGFAARVDRDFKVDLLRVDDLSVIGRSGARTAAIWLSVAAVICLFFVDGQALSVAVATVVFSAGMALWIFYRSLDHVHRRIREAKRAELDRLRHAIAGARALAVDDAAAAMKLHGLLAYETRIEAVHEWPFDHLTLFRVAAYVLIPAIPAFGQTALKSIAQHFGQ